MKKFIRTIFILLTATMLVTGIAGCKKSDNPIEKPSDNKEAEGPQDADSEKEDSTIVLPILP